MKSKVHPIDCICTNCEFQRYRSEQQERKDDEKRIEKYEKQYKN